MCGVLAVRKMKIKFDICPFLPYLIYMTIARLQEIIDNNAEAAEAGDPTAQGLVVTAMAELEDLIARNKALEAERDEWCEGAGIPVDPFTEALDAKARHEAMVAQAEADQAFWNEQEQVIDDLPEDIVEDWGHHDQWGHDQG